VQNVVQYIGTKEDREYMQQYEFNFSSGSHKGKEVRPHPPFLPSLTHPCNVGGRRYILPNIYPDIAARPYELLSI